MRLSQILTTWTILEMNDFIFCPTYKKFCNIDGSHEFNYLYHELSTDVTPVPKCCENGRQVQKEYEFFYDRWESKMSRNKIHQWGTTVENLFPSERKSSLDPTKLKKLGLTKEQMCGTDGNPDVLFFYKLLLSTRVFSVFLLQMDR